VRVCARVRVLTDAAHACAAEAACGKAVMRAMRSARPSRFDARCHKAKITRVPVTQYARHALRRRYVIDDAMRDIC